MIDISKTLVMLHQRLIYLGELLKARVTCDRRLLVCAIECQPSDAVILFVKDICKEVGIPTRCIEVCDHTYDTQDVNVSVALGKLVDEQADSFYGVREYLVYRKGLKNQEDFSVSENIRNVEFYLGGAYFCSVGESEPGFYEVFELHHGAEVSEDGKEWLTDGELWQYKVFRSLKSAIDFAVSCRFKGKLPSKPIMVW